MADALLEEMRIKKLNANGWMIGVLMRAQWGKKFQGPGKYFRGTTYVFVAIIFCLSSCLNFVYKRFQDNVPLSLMFSGGEKREHCLGWNNALDP